MQIKTGQFYFYHFWRILFKKIFKTKFIGVQLIYNVVLVSGVQQSESVIDIHVSNIFGKLKNINNVRRNWGLPPFSTPTKEV